MRTSLKAALAGVAGAGLLLGGAGSLAFWTDEETVDGAAVNGGELSLAEISCGDWSLNGGVTAFVPATDLIVPGDELVQVCNTKLAVEGDSLTGTLAVELPDMTGATGLTDELVPTSTFTLGGGDEVATVTVGPDDDQKAIVVTTKINFPFGVKDNDSNRNLSAALADFPLTLTQTP